MKQLKHFYAVSDRCSFPAVQNIQQFANSSRATTLSLRVRIAHTVSSRGDEGVSSADILCINMQKLVEDLNENQRLNLEDLNDLIKRNSKYV